MNATNATNTTSAITAVTPNVSLTGTELSYMIRIAGYLLKSGFLPKAVDNEAKAISIMMLSRELGVGFWQGFSGVNVISGKPSVSPQLMLALINRSGQLENMRIDSTDTGCAVMMKRVGRDPHTEAFTLDDAKRFTTSEGFGESKRTIPLADKANWKSQPRVMLKWRAVAACARVVFPDVIQGMYTPEELGADVEVDEEGAMTITVTPEVVTPHVPTSPSQSAQSAPEAPDAPNLRLTTSNPAPTQSDDLTRSPYAGTWFDDKAARDAYLDWLRNKAKLTDGQDVGLTGKHAWQYPDGKAACAAVIAAVNTRDTNHERHEQPAEPQHDPERRTQFAVVCDQYVTTPERMIDLLQGKLPEEYSSVAAMRGAVHNVGHRKQLDFRPMSMRYERSGNGKKFIVSAPGQIEVFTIFGGREQLGNLLSGDAAVASAALGMDAWEVGHKFAGDALNGLVFSWRIEKREGKDVSVISKARWQPSEVPSEVMRVVQPAAPSPDKTDEIWETLDEPVEEEGAIGEPIPS